MIDMFNIHSSSSLLLLVRGNLCTLLLIWLETQSSIPRKNLNFLTMHIINNFLPLREHLITNGTCGIITEDLAGIFIAWYTVKETLHSALISTFRWREKGLIICIWQPKFHYRRHLDTQKVTASGGNGSPFQFSPARVASHLSVQC